MKIKKWLPTLGITLCLGVIANARADEETPPKPPVQVIGDLRPEYSVELTGQDFEMMRRQMENLPKLDRSFTVDINDLYKPADAEAIRRMKQLFLSQVLEVSADLVDLKGILYKLVVRLATREGKVHAKELYEAYQASFQSAYARMIQRFNVEDTYRQIIDACQSDLCAMNVTDAVLEILRFAEELNSGIEVDELEDWEFEWKFENKLLQASLSESVETFNPRNTSTVPGYSLIAMTAGGLAYAGKATLEIGEFVANVLGGARITKLEIEAESTDINFERLQLRIGHFLSIKLEAVALNVLTQDVKRRGIRYHEHVLLCYTGVKDLHMAHVLIGGITFMECKSAREDGIASDFHYDIEMGTIGPGLAISGAGAIVVISSPVEMTPTGFYGGVAASGGALLYAGVGLYFGPYGSIATVLYGGGGIGGAAGLSGFFLEY